MKKEYSFITTYYDDVITEGGGDFCGRYAQSVDTIRATYCGAVLHYYRARNRIEADDPRGIEPDFYIKQFYRFLFHDFRYMVKSRGCTRPQHFYRLRYALLEVVKHNARITAGALRLAIKYAYKSKALQCAWELMRLELEAVKIDFS